MLIITKLNFDKTIIKYLNVNKVNFCIFVGFKIVFILCLILLFYNNFLISLESVLIIVSSFLFFHNKLIIIINILLFLKAKTKTKNQNLKLPIKFFKKLKSTAKSKTKN